MRTKLQKINEGFTIVEVLIVLAIAALILVIILIAVPDLQRSARNTDIYHDAQNIAAAVQTYEGNNSGALPNVAGITGPVSSVETITNSTTGGAEATAHVQSGDTITPVSGPTAETYGTSPLTGQGYIVVEVDALCGTVSGTTMSAGSSSTRAVAVVYPIEGPSTASSSVGCIQE